MYHKILTTSASVDISKYTWMKYVGKRPKYYREHNRYHDLKLENGEVYGYYRTRNGNYRIIESTAQNIIFLLSDREFQSLYKSSKPYKGKIQKQVGSTKVRKNAQHRFVAKQDDIVGEPRIIKKTNYLWFRFRKTSPLEVFDRNNKKSLTLSPSEIFGLRFVSPKRGGVLVLEDGKRIRVSMDTYDKLEGLSTALRKQPTGVIRNVTQKTTKEKEKQSLVIRFVGDKLNTETTDTVERKRTDVIERDKESEKLIDTINKIANNISEEDIEESLYPKEYEQEPKKVSRKRKDDSFIKEIEKENEDIVEDLHIGNVITFKQDKEKIPYLVVDKEPLEDNETIDKYILYNIKDKPDTVNIIRLASDVPEQKVEKLIESSKKAPRSWLKEIKGLRLLEENKEPVYKK